MRIFPLFSISPRLINPLPPRGDVGKDQPIKEGSISTKKPRAESPGFLFRLIANNYV